MTETLPSHGKDESSRARCAVGLLTVLCVYSLPFAMQLFRREPHLHIAVEDEKIYLARVVDAYRGGSLGNPYLAEHQDAERFMPELAERTLASIARATGFQPLAVVGASRVFFPALIYLVLWSLARGLAIEPRPALVAALLAPLGPTISWIGRTESTGVAFLRYFRAISPAFYVLALLLVLRATQMALQRPSWRTSLLVGAGGGLLFYMTPVYYWTFAVGGLIVLAALTTGRARAGAAAAVVIACAIGAPHLARALHQGGMPVVRETLARFDLLTPGRAPDVYVIRSFIVAGILLVPIWRWRRGIRGGDLLASFAAVGTTLMVQNVVTGHHVQGYHWIECLIPIWSLAGGAFVQMWSVSLRATHVNGLSAAVLLGALICQGEAYRHWVAVQRENPEFWALDARMPEMLKWLDEHTAVNSVVVAEPDVMDSLVLYSHNKVYWTDYASQHVISDSEVQARKGALEQCHPGAGPPLPFTADFYLGEGAVCDVAWSSRLLYRNGRERTCVWWLGGDARGDGALANGGPEQRQKDTDVRQ